MKAVGVFGGTFDPVHNGHLITAQAVYEQRDLEKVIFIPVNISPHKRDKESSSAEHRLNMLKAAVRDISYFEVSDIEISCGGVSYTINTLRELKKTYANIELILGYDNLHGFHTWKESEEILKLAKLVILKRKTAKGIIPDDLLKRCILLETPIIEISATGIRERAVNDLPLNFLVPERVMEYIYTFNLYKRKK